MEANTAESPTFDWLLSFGISFAVCVLLFSVTKSVKIFFSTSRTRNQLTLLPYYCLILYLAFKIVQKSVTISLNHENATNKVLFNL